MSNHTTDTLIALLSGVAIGVGVGVLFAPDKGSETRKKIKDKFDKGKEELSDKYEDLIAMLKEKVNQTESRFDESLDKLVSEGKDKTEDVIEILEAKLAALKKEVAKK